MQRLILPVFREISTIPADNGEWGTVRTIKASRADDGVQVKVSAVDQVDSSFGHLVNLTGDNGDIGLQQRFQVTLTRRKSNQGLVSLSE